VSDQGLAAEETGSEMGEVGGMDVVTTSTVYIGRASFRMEQVVLPANAVSPQPDSGPPAAHRKVTAPLGVPIPLLLDSDVQEESDESEEDESAPGASSEVTHRVSRLVVLAGGAASGGEDLEEVEALPRRSKIQLTRWALVAFGGLAFASGMVVAPWITSARARSLHRQASQLSSSASPAAGTTNAVAATPVAMKVTGPVVMPMAPAAPPLEGAPTLVAAAAPVPPDVAPAAAAQPAERPAARRPPPHDAASGTRRPRSGAGRRPPSDAPSGTTWVDPFAE
jgi:hypothetical protein